MTATSTTTIDSVRARFSTLQRPLAFFDGPGGTQVPDSVIDAIAGYLRNSNANLGGDFDTSRASDALLATAHETAGRFLNADPDEVAFGQNMTTLNFALSRTAAREWVAGDEVVCTRLDHDGNVSPWLELAHDKGLTVRFAEVDDECRLDLDHLRSLLSERTRVVAFPWASNGVGTVTPVAEIAALAHEAGALAWVDAVHYGPLGPIDVRAAGADVLICSPYKFVGARPKHGSPDRAVERFQPRRLTPQTGTHVPQWVRDGYRVARQDALGGRSAHCPDDRARSARRVGGSFHADPPRREDGRGSISLWFVPRSSRSAAARRRMGTVRRHRHGRRDDDGLVASARCSLTF